jgi:hypothetical protein
MFLIKEIVEKKPVKEASNLPAIAKAAGVSTNPQITQVARQDTIFSTLQAMGLDPYVNKMRNVVVEVPDLATMSAVMKIIYEQFGVKGSMVIPWDGMRGKIYYDPKTPVETAKTLSYVKTNNLPAPSKTGYLA